MSPRPISGRIWRRAARRSLVELLIDQAGRDERLREQLVLEVARHRGGAVDVYPLYRAIDDAVGRNEDFDNHLAGVRSAHRPKRNFIKRLDAAAW